MRESIIELRQEHPEYSISEISRLTGFSRYIVTRTLKEHGLQTKREHTIYTCPSCGKVVSKGVKLCRQCRHVTAICSYCGREIVRRRADENRAQKLGYRHRFCSKKCQALYMVMVRNVGK